MNLPVDRFVHWFLDLHLLSSLLLLAGLLILSRLHQPALRMAVARSVAVGLVTLAMVVAAPSWPRTAWPLWPGNVAVPSMAASILPIEREPADTPTPRKSDSPRLQGEAPIAVMQSASVLAVRQSMLGRSTRVYVLPGWRSMLFAVYAIGVGVNLAWLALGAIQAARLKRTVRTANSRIPTLLARVGGDARDGTGVCLSTRIGLPVAIGVVRPMIVLPEQFATDETDEALEAALAHELAHIRNGDLRWLAIVRLLTIVFFSQPLFWLLRRTIRADQEALADAAASTLHAMAASRMQKRSSAGRDHRTGPDPAHSHQRHSHSGTGLPCSCAA